MHLILDPCTRFFGISILQKHLIAFQQEMDGVRAGQDVEYIHRMRVATRRLRCALPVFSNAFPESQVKTWLKHISRVTRTLGSARDTDVQIELLHHILLETGERRYQSGLQRLILRLSQTRQYLQEGVEKALDLILSQNVLQDMTQTFSRELAKIQPNESISLSLSRLGCDTVSLKLDAFLSYQHIIQKPENIKELHAMRIAAKWLRYSMEIFAPIYPDGLTHHLSIIRKVQDTLGTIHDCDFWEIFLLKFYQEERERILQFYGNTNPFNPIFSGLEYFQQNRQRERINQYETFIRDWTKWTTKGVWRNLNCLVSAPLTHPGPFIQPTVFSG
jgi:CHAD domain-containing protein